MIVADVEPPGAAPMVIAGLALPPMLMTCGESGASSVRVTVAARGPVANGANVTLMEQLAFTA